MPERRVGEIPENGVRRGLGACLSGLDHSPTDRIEVGNGDDDHLNGQWRWPGLPYV
jgi:hypothetical protein